MTPESFMSNFRGFVLFGLIPPPQWLENKAEAARPPRGEACKAYRVSTAYEIRGRGDKALLEPLIIRYLQNTLLPQVVEYLVEVARFLRRDVCKIYPVSTMSSLAPRVILSASEGSVFRYASCHRSRQIECRGWRLCNYISYRYFH